MRYSRADARRDAKSMKVSYEVRSAMSDYKWVERSMVVPESYYAQAAYMVQGDDDAKVARYVVRWSEVGEDVDSVYVRKVRVVE